MPDALLWVLGGFTLLATGLAYVVRGGQWWARFFDFPRVQIVACGLAAVALSPFAGPSAWRWPLAALIGAAVIWQGCRIWPYTPLHRKQALDARSRSRRGCIRILIANVWMPNRNAPALLERIREADPDIVFALETDVWWKDALAPLIDTYRHALLRPQDNTYGMLLYSRLELIEPEVRCLVSEAVPSVRTGVRLRSGEPLLLLGLHPEPPDIFQDTWERDAELLIAGREAAAVGQPCIVAGDLNDVAWSRTTRLFQRVSGLVDPRVGRGLFNSYHARLPVARWPLDQVFHSPALRVVSLRRLAPFGSDHFPIMVDLSLEPGPAAFEQAPDRRDGDRAEAAARIAEGTE